MQGGVRRDRCRELHDAVIEEGEAPFNRVTHAHAVALGREDVTGHQDAGLQKLRLLEGMPAVVVIGQRVE